MDSTVAKYKILRELVTKTNGKGLTFNRIRDKVLKGETTERTTKWLEELKNANMLEFIENPMKKRGIEKGTYRATEHGEKIFITVLQKWGIPYIKLLT